MNWLNCQVFLLTVHLFLSNLCVIFNSQFTNSIARKTRQTITQFTKMWDSHNNNYFSTISTKSEWRQDVKKNKLLHWKLSLFLRVALMRVCKNWLHLMQIGSWTEFRKLKSHLTWNIVNVEKKMKTFVKIFEKLKLLKH